MNIKKLLLLGVLTFALGLAACSDKESGSILEDNGNTHVAVTLKFALGNPDTRALPEDYNSVGKWAGRDEFKDIAIFVIDGLNVIARQYSAEDFNDPVTDPSSGSITLTPKKAIRITPGEKTIYVLINGTAPVVSALAKENAVEFEQAYTNAALKLQNSGTSLNVETSADKLVEQSAEKEAIVMTNSAKVRLTVEEGVSETEALNGRNRANVRVERAVARVMITTASNVYELKSSSGTKLGEISNIKWVLAQGENSLYIQSKGAPDYETPAYGYIPVYARYWDEAGAKYDYSGLFENYDITTQFGGTQVPLLDTYVALNANKDNQEEVLESLNLDLNAVKGKFILPTTHKYATGESSGYKKGNTAYVLVRAKLKPAVFADGDAGNYSDGDDFWLGANGKFYLEGANALDPSKGGVAGQEVAKYVGGKVLYYAWINPDSVPIWYNSPVVRNNIYHIHITGFKSIGTNWNPLYPEDPDTTNPKNPDPKPEGPNEPDNPTDPDNPLIDSDTWINLDVKVLPWNVHSYVVELNI